ncbi:MAG: metallophosphoesterase family protein [Coriobacteriales bacterium]|jgi:putative phosphoesterase
MQVLGIISDTHGSLPEAALDVLRGWYGPGQVVERVNVDRAAELPAGDPAPCDLIVHAGDIGAQWVLDELRALAPLVAVLGNCDYPDYWLDGKQVGQHAVGSLCGVTFAVLHRPEDLMAATRGAGVLQPAFIKPIPRLLIHGHTHVPKIATQAAGYVVCPGGISRPRGGHGPCVARVYVEEPAKLLAIEIVRI